jgi:hypothetical protein
MCYLFLEETKKTQRHGMDKTLNLEDKKKPFMFQDVLKIWKFLKMFFILFPSIKGFYNLLVFYSIS